MSTIVETIDTIAHSIMSYSDSMWQDEGADATSGLLSGLDNEEWAYLISKVYSYDPVLLMRLAYSVVNLQSTQAIAFLVALVNLDNNNVSIAACDALHVVLTSTGISITISPSTCHRIIYLSTIAVEPWKSSCASLYKSYCVHQ